ncbi:hypothetical protein F9U64_19260 [Gracilibacillus oryzae]|uniref:Uncharacterized protein n=1 Tax=Gracilibacillus oryzae TaxID=1672701 RepID=A0A7C8KSJ8_9BACI|nr:hypothetical protein [Gracilibacillus oryzae]KAB8126747.1 hypothetical protein F9U64_19260 [Gracilibacillus oryzae]
MESSEAHLKIILDKEAAEREAELRIEEARAQGIKQGIQEMREQVIKNMLTQGLPHKKIATYTGSTIEEVEKIRNEE